jgi:hypothetical protein
MQFSKAKTQLSMSIFSSWSPCWPCLMKDRKWWCGAPRDGRSAPLRTAAETNPVLAPAHIQYWNAYGKQ